MPTQNPNAHAEREQQILDAAADVFIHYGFDKTTMSDIADHASVTRAIVYLHFDSKERLFEALLYRETERYLQNWLEALETSTSSGKIAYVFQGALRAVRRSPFLAALMKQDRQVFGKYLSKPGNFLELTRSRSVWPEMLKALRAAGAIRNDVQPEVMGHIMNALAVGILALEEDQHGSETPAFEDLMETTAFMLDRALTPADGGNTVAGKAILQQFAQAARSQLKLGERPGDRDSKP